MTGIKHPIMKAEETRIRVGWRSSTQRLREENAALAIVSRVVLVPAPRTTNSAPEIRASIIHHSDSPAEMCPRPPADGAHPGPGRAHLLRLGAACVATSRGPRGLLEIAGVDLVYASRAANGITTTRAPRRDAGLSRRRNRSGNRHPVALSVPAGARADCTPRCPGHWRAMRSSIKTAPRTSTS